LTVSSGTATINATASAFVKLTRLISPFLALLNLAGNS
jgi:hypothetical protein